MGSSLQRRRTARIVPSGKTAPEEVPQLPRGSPMVRIASSVAVLQPGDIPWWRQEWSVVWNKDLAKLKQELKSEEVGTPKKPVPKPVPKPEAPRELEDEDALFLAA